MNHENCHHSQLTLPSSRWKHFRHKFSVNERDNCVLCLIFRALPCHHYNNNLSIVVRRKSFIQFSFTHKIYYFQRQEKTHEKPLKKFLNDTNQGFLWKCLSFFCIFCTRRHQLFSKNSNKSVIFHRLLLLLIFHFFLDSPNSDNGRRMIHQKKRNENKNSIFNERKITSENVKMNEINLFTAKCY